MKRVLIFGAGGFVGRYLAAEFYNSGYEVYGSDIIEASSTPDYVCFQPCDLLNSDGVNKLFEALRPNYVINLAAISSVGVSWKVPQKTVAVNVEGALNILEGARHCKSFPKVLMIGSSEEYAITDKPIREDFPLDANNPYGLSKVMQEQFMEMYRQRYKMQIFRVRAFNHTGVGQSPFFVLPSWCKQAAQISKSGKPGVVKVGNLDVWRDFSDVRDVVRAYRMIIESDDCDIVYNVGSGTAYSLRELLKCIVSFSQQPIETQVDPNLYRPADNPVICCDHSLIAEKLAWEPMYSLYETLRDLFDSFLSAS